MTSAIITCAGKSERTGFSENKLLHELNGKTPFEMVLSAFKETNAVDEYIVTYNGEDNLRFSRIAESLGLSIKLVKGGSSRSESVGNALAEVSGDIVVIHDGARPFVTPGLILDSIESAKKYGSGVAAIPETDTLCNMDKARILNTFRSGVWKIQTPQTFRTELIRKAFKEADKSVEFTDESGLYASIYGECMSVMGAVTNIKLTYKEDFEQKEDIRCGTGFDIHILVEDRKLILGGIEIPHTKGLLGHSDADVLLHAMMDAMLSSASLGDIGKYFPDTDERYRGISSVSLMLEVKRLLAEAGFKVKNISAVIMAQKPKLAPYVDKIVDNIAKILDLPKDCVGITCTTMEGIGIVGREEGIATQAYCLVAGNRQNG